MKKSGKILCWVLGICLLISAVLLGGCGQAGKTSSGNDKDTITLIDCLGREVKVSSQVERVACLCPESVYALALFGQGDKIVASVDGPKRDIILTNMYPRIKDVPMPKVSGAINIEELVRCDPDVVFVKPDSARNEAEAEKMAKSNIPYLVVEFKNMQEQQYAMDMIAKALGTSEKATKYNKYYRDRMEAVEKQLAHVPSAQRVKVYHSVNEATRTDIAGSLSSEWLKAAGAINVALTGKVKKMEGKYFASLEQILLWNPEVILVNDIGVVDYILNNKQWAPLKAVQNKRVYHLPSGVSRWGHPSSPETPLVIMWTAKTLYPEYFTELDMVGETRYFYQEFFGMELSDETINKILYGGGMRAAR